MSSDLPAVPLRSSNDIVAFRRDDLAALASGRSSLASGAAVGAAIPAVGLTVFGVLVAVGELGHVAMLSGPLALLAGVAAALGLGVQQWRRERVRRAACAFACPACGASIISAAPWADDQARVETVIASGRCPGCGAVIVDD